MLKCTTAALLILGLHTPYAIADIHRDLAFSGFARVVGGQLSTSEASYANYDSSWSFSGINDIYGAVLSLTYNGFHFRSSFMRVTEVVDNSVQIDQLVGGLPRRVSRNLLKNLDWTMGCQFKSLAQDLHH